MLHARVTCPAGSAAALADELLTNPGVLNVVVFAGASRSPDGDLIQFDVAREAANEIITLLRTRGIDKTGSISLDRVDSVLSDAAATAEELAPGDPTEAIIWEEVEARVRSESGLSGSLVALLSIAVCIAAVGILTDSAVLIVGAMVIGPEYGPLASIALGLHKRTPHRVVRGLRTLVIAFPIAILLGLVLALAIRVCGWTPEAYLRGVRPLTGFVSRPDVFSVIVAVLAGVAGTMSLTESKASALVGVLVSVTTVPAAANIGVAIAYQRANEAIGASQQLLINLVAICLVGVLTLRVQWAITARLTASGSG